MHWKISDFLFEIFRYFGSDKAKAWCGTGDYTPPWQAQVDFIEQREEEARLADEQPDSQEER